MSDDLSRMSRGELLALLRVERSQVERDLATKRRSAARVQEVRQIPRAIAESEALGLVQPGHLTCIRRMLSEGVNVGAQRIRVASK